MWVRYNKSQQKQIRRFVNKMHNKEHVNLYDVFMAISYVVITGIQWHMLPDKYPGYTTVYYHFRKWSEDFTLQNFLKKLVEMKRLKRGRKPQPTVAVIDSQSVRSGYNQSAKGVDGYKKVKGIKRQLAVDADGLPLCIDITMANVNDSKGAQLLLNDLHKEFPSILLIKADKGYRGTTTPQEVALECVKSNFGTSDFVPLSGRWVVERTISWFVNYRRLNRNYERYLTTAKAIAYFASILIVLRC